MNTRKVLALSLILILSVSVFAFGDDHVTKVEAFLAGDLNFNVDGEQWSPKDVDGSDLTPIIYKDRTYIPVRSLLEDKGVTVGYEADTRTVLLDYSTINIAKPIDKATPLLFDTMMVEGGGGGAGKVSMKELSIKKNPDFDIDSMEMTQEMNFSLSEEAKIVIDDRMIESSLDEILKSESSWNMNSAVLSINEETGEVEKISISTIDADDGSPNAAKIDIDIKISWPPWKVTITISF
jgi:hypothetical protein